MKVNKSKTKKISEMRNLGVVQEGEYQDSMASDQSQFVCRVYHMDGTKWEVTFDAQQMTIEDLKRRIESAHGVKARQQHLFVKGESDEITNVTRLDPNLHRELFMLYNTRDSYVDEVDGDPVNCDAKYIVHNCHCSQAYGSARARGLTKAMFDRYPHANVYASRKFVRTPGTISVMGDGSSRKRFVVNLYGQRSHSAPREKYECTLTRQKWFAQGLEQLARLGSELSSVAFPSLIGCRMLEGGDWVVYRQMIEDFAENVAQHDVSVTIYKPLEHK